MQTRVSVRSTVDTWQRALRGSRYPADSRRDERIDMLRGLFVAVMVVDHVGGWSPLRLLTGDGNFYVTAAEGFVAVSGFTYGMVYRRTLDREGPRELWRRSLRRACLLYGILLATTALVASMSFFAHLGWARDVHGLLDFARLMLRIATFRAMFPFTRILAMYCLVVLAGAGALQLMSAGFTLPVLALSALLYFVYQLGPVRFGKPFPENVYFHPYAYQLLFLGMAALGYHRHAVGTRFEARAQRRLFFAGSVGLVALLVLYVLRLGPLGGERYLWVDALFYRDYLRPGRLLATALAIPVFYLGITYVWRPLREHLGGLFLPLGRNALTSYALHLPFVVVFEYLSRIANRWGSWSLGFNAAAQLGVLAVVCAAARSRPLLESFKGS